MGRFQQARSSAVGCGGFLMAFLAFELVRARGSISTSQRFHLIVKMLLVQT